jgi:hypothetical protein
MATHGENRRPSVGNFDGRPWGDSHGRRQTLAPRMEGERARRCCLRTKWQPAEPATGGLRCSRSRALRSLMPRSLEAAFRARREVGHGAVRTGAPLSRCMGGCRPNAVWTAIVGEGHPNARLYRRSGPGRAPVAGDHPHQAIRRVEAGRKVTLAAPVETGPP